MNRHSQSSGQINLLAALVLVAIVVGGIWVWNHLSFDTQDIIVEEVLPIVLVVILAGVGIWIIIRNIRHRRRICEKRDRLIARFEKESSTQKRLDFAFALIELNRYELKGLESIAEPMAELFIWKLKTGLG